MSQKTQSLADLSAYEARIKVLRSDAIADGYDLNKASERDFRHFILSGPYTRKGNLVLIDNGNLRAIWRDGHDTHIGLQFLGNETVQYVIFKRREGAASISRVAGRDSIEGIKRQIAGFDLLPLLCA